MLINVNDHPSLTSAVQEADSVKNQGGSTIYIPGRVAPHYANDILWPENTQVFGDGNGSKLLGRSVVSHVMGGEFSHLNFIDGIDLLHCRMTEFNHILFSTADALTYTGLVRMSGASYYNTFSMCSWYKVDRMMLVTGQCNFNKIRDCRTFHFGNAFVMKADFAGKLADGWKLEDNAFEGFTPSGSGNIGAHITLRGKKHIIKDGWYEPGGHKSYIDYAIIFEEDANGCEVVGGWRPWHWTARDRSGGNRW